MSQKEKREAGEAAKTPDQIARPMPALTPEAKRALAEAEERRAATAKAEEARAKEIGGQKGPEPTRYGDWEKKGIISDF
ncbi:MAG: hypothetical protein RJB62_893 [Pseudomonadota bacterium]|jgi:hypothetical protein